MKWPFRRHRGSQSEAPTPTYRMHITAPDGDPKEIAWLVAARLAGRSVPEPVTARQSLTASLSRDQDLANEPDRLFSLVDDILLDLEANGLTIVASTEVEDAPEVLGRARQDRPPGW